MFLSWEYNPNESSPTRQLYRTRYEFEKLSTNKNNLFAGTAGVCIHMHDWTIKRKIPQYQEYCGHISDKNSPIMGHILGGKGCIGINSTQVKCFCVITTEDE